ncbi:hypothetical protein [Endozoicomonas atrinae]|uniref:hypothetical protein n=1 Tax=Endozoicomonas atrinae TaxID=1333660 RepID=UPI003AFFF655
MSQEFDVVELEPLPAHFIIEEIELGTESHWSINFDYIYNRIMFGMGSSEYVIGLTNNGKPKETTAIKIGERYYSPLINQNTPFLILQIVDSDTLFAFYDTNFRPCCLADFDNEHVGASLDGSYPLRTSAPK